VLKLVVLLLISLIEPVALRLNAKNEPAKTNPSFELRQGYEKKD
jgi:hypothetical protein